MNIASAFLLKLDFQNNVSIFESASSEIVVKISSKMAKNSNVTKNKLVLRIMDQQKLQITIRPNYVAIFRKSFFN